MGGEGVGAGRLDAPRAPRGQAPEGRRSPACAAVAAARPSASSRRHRLRALAGPCALLAGHRDRFPVN